MIDTINWPAKIEGSGHRHSLAHWLSSGRSQCSPCNWWPVGHSLGPKRLRWVTDDTILPLNIRLKSAITSSPPRVETITGVTIPCFWRQVMWVIRGFSMSRREEVCEWSESLTDTVAGVFCVAVWLQCGSTRSAGLRSCSFSPAHEHNALAFHNSKPPFFCEDAPWKYTFWKGQIFKYFWLLWTLLGVFLLLIALNITADQRPPLSP